MTPGDVGYGDGLRNIFEIFERKKGATPGTVASIASQEMDF